MGNVVGVDEDRDVVAAVAIFPAARASETLVYVLYTVWDAVRPVGYAARRVAIEPARKPHC